MRWGILLTGAFLAGCASAGSSTVARGQIPDAAAGGGAVAGAGAGGATGTAAAGAAGAAQPRLLGRIFKGPQGWAQCRQRFCSSPAGQLVNNMLKPISAMTGGLIPPLCVQNGTNAEKLAQPAQSAAGASERMKAEEAGAKAKIADIQYLAGKDCRRFPEAEAALIASLRAEKLECVRLAAAKALLTGCCCTPKIIKALTICVSGSEKDGNLSEESERVRMTAFVALEKCLRSCQPVKPEEPPEKPKDKLKQDPKDVALTQVGFEVEDPDKVYAEARAVLARGLQVSDSVMRQMNSSANLRDLLLGPPSKPTGPVMAQPSTVRDASAPAQPGVVTAAPLPMPVVEVAPSSATTPAVVIEQKPARSLLGIIRESIGK